VRTACKVITGLYIALSIGSLVIIPLNAVGMAGEPDPLTGIFAVLLAAPWIWLTSPITSDTGTAWNMIVAGTCMALNAAILWQLCRWITGKAAR
jgi:hypothetical protein